MFGQKNPRRVAERQLNQAELDLLEVSTALESYQSNKKTLEDRIVRLRAYLKQDAGAERDADKPEDLAFVSTPTYATVVVRDEKRKNTRGLDQADFGISH